MTHLEFDRESSVWRHWIDDLSSRRSLVRYDERGCGLSDWDTDDFSFETWIEIGVTSQPSAVLLAANGEPISGWIGPFPEDEVLRLAAESQAAAAAG